MQLKVSPVLTSCERAGGKNGGGTEEEGTYVYGGFGDVAIIHNNADRST